MVCRCTLGMTWRHVPIKAGHAHAASCDRPFRPWWCRRCSVQLSFNIETGAAHFLTSTWSWPQKGRAACKTISAEIEINEIHVTPCSSVRHANQFQLCRLETNCALGRWLDSETGGSRGERSANKNHVVVKGMGEETHIYRIKKALRPPPQLRSRAQPFPALELAN
jgi:hypothetical protein